MGLDMYLYRTKRIKDFNVSDYVKVDDVLGNLKEVPTTLEDEIDDFKVEMDILLTESHQPFLPYFRSYRILKEVMYWRKANAIHNWFVRECQNGIDECQMVEVSKDKLTNLINACENKTGLEPIAGFFFGSTDKDDYYYETLKETANSLKVLLEETNFDEEIIFYRSSW